MTGRSVLDLERVICAVEEIPDGGARGFAIGEGDWPLRGLLVRQRDAVRAYVNRCPHAGHQLNLMPHRFLTPDSAAILCTAHGAIFDKMTGLCLVGPCPGRSLTPVPVRIEAGHVMLADDVDPAALNRGND
jgi:nitrite reductase/ring-hydroxylating ferredoxin subunit